jgi:hypothetical protein
VKELELPVKNVLSAGRIVPSLRKPKARAVASRVATSQLLPGQRQDDHAIDFVVSRLRKLQDYSI